MQFAGGTYDEGRCGVRFCHQPKIVKQTALLLARPDQTCPQRQQQGWEDACGKGAAASTAEVFASATVLLLVLFNIDPSSFSLPLPPMAPARDASALVIVQSDRHRRQKIRLARGLPQSWLAAESSLSDVGCLCHVSSKRYETPSSSQGVTLTRRLFAR